MYMPQARPSPGQRGLGPGRGRDGAGDFDAPVVRAPPQSLTSWGRRPPARHAALVESTRAASSCGR
ncbi:hypothetical protein SBRY_50311 [Actinacidiphila bryophytorum]|uniref:Uncharacterized protein n=1 Tax=Actinacidiphila bryophytorum TaxID=1436133 RepID=A0A9W4H4Q4_9ACTN|nr:hypothetical protein SBRY_50311 [Actinacidiphila bryophytorum]